MLKIISSTEVKNNMGKVLEDLGINRTRFIIERHGSPIAVLLNCNDLLDILGSKENRIKLKEMIEQHKPNYSIGKEVS